MNSTALGSSEELNTEKQESDRGETLSAPGSFSVPPFTEDLRELQKGLLCSDEFLIHKRPEVAGNQVEKPVVKEKGKGEVL